MTHARVHGIEGSQVVPYLNRLADYLWMAARQVEPDWESSTGRCSGMSFTVRTAPSVDAAKADVLVVPVLDGLEWGPGADLVADALGEGLTDFLAAQDFTGAAGQHVAVPGGDSRLRQGGPGRARLRGRRRGAAAGGRRRRQGDHR